MALEDYVNSLKGRPTLQGAEKAKEEKFEQEVLEKHKTEADFLEEIKKAEQVRREKIEDFAKRVPQFLSQVDECVANYHAKYQNKKNRHESFLKYDEILIKLRGAIEVFLSNIEDKEFVELLENDITIISTMCKEMYTLDNTFPDFAFLDEDKFKEAAIKKVYKDPEMAKGVRFEKVGRFTIIGGAGDHYTILDQQAQKTSKKEIYAIGKVRNNSIVIHTYTNGFFGDAESKIFVGETGKTSQGYSSIEPTIGNLWVGKQRGGFSSLDILDAQGKIIHSYLSRYVPNKKKSRALIGKDFYGKGYNILLDNGKLLFENGGELQSGYLSSIGADQEIAHDIILKFEEKFVKLNKNLEIVAEGPSLEEMQQIAA